LIANSVAVAVSVAVVVVAVVVAVAFVLCNAKPTHTIPGNVYNIICISVATKAAFPLFSCHTQ